MTDIEKILYRGSSKEKFEKYISIGGSPLLHGYYPNFSSLEEFKDFVEDGDIASILVDMIYSLMIYDESSEDFIEKFGEELYNFYNEEDTTSEIAYVASDWFDSWDLPIFNGLDLNEVDKRIKESECYSNGEYKYLEFTDGSEVKILHDGGFSWGYYVPETKYSKLLEGINSLRKLVNGSHTKS